EAAEQEAEGGGDQGGPSAAGQEPEHPAGDGEVALPPADGVGEGVVRVARLGEADDPVGPDQSLGGDESMDGGPGPLLGDAGQAGTPMVEARGTVLTGWEGGPKIGGVEAPNL